MEVAYLIDFETAGIYYLMVATFAGMFGSPSILVLQLTPLILKNFFPRRITSVPAWLAFLILV